MKKLSSYFLILVFLSSCSTIKYVPENELLLTKNTIYVDSVKSSKNTVSDLLLQRPNARALGLPLSLYFYNLGNPDGSKDIAEWEKNHPKWYHSFESLFSKKQSIAVANTFMNFNNWFLENGEAPVVIKDKKIQRTKQNLVNYYFTEGYFKAKVSSKKDTLKYKKGAVNYYISKGKPSFLDSIFTNIKSPTLDSIYKENASENFLTKGAQYKNENFIKETERIIKLFRNKGIYHFNENNILFDNDTLGNYEKTNVEIAISDRLIEKGGNYTSKPFKIQKIKKINIFTDYLYKLRNDPFKDSIKYNGVNYYAYNKLKYNPKYLSQSIFIQPNQLYTDSLRNLTRNHIRGLKNFKTTSIRYEELNDNELEANIYLTPIEKYTVGLETELARSNIRTFDVSAKFSITNRNTFKGAETFKLSVSGSYFNAASGFGWEVGSNISLEVPRFMAPFGLQKLVPKRMYPKTIFYTGISIQKNIALDKQNISLGIDYKWQYNKKRSIQLELLNAQYIRNLNVNNYFNIYNSEYSDLATVNEVYTSINTNAPTLEENSQNQDISTIVSVMSTIASDSNFQASNPTEYQNNINILNRYNIITSDFLIPVIAYNYTFNNQENLKDADFSYFKVRVANSGNIMGLLSNISNAKDQKTVFKLPLAQYFKTDLEYKKFWSIGETSVLAHRSFLGAIIRYNNSDIPFSKSYFAGGSNDIRAWKTYDLGPGSRPQALEYNIGSLKFLSSFEYRFNVVGSLKSALFVDVGNIWDITNSSFVDDASKFTGIKSLSDMAVAAGFGIRYDLKFLVARLDLGFKVREPYLNNSRWFQNANFTNAVYNIGINYPF